jgi:uncharacterized protein
VGEREAWIVGTQGTVIWFEIWVSDLERSKAFYSGLFDWRFEPLSGYDAEKYWQIMASPSAGVNGALVHDPERDKPTGRTSVLYVHVPDLEHATEVALSLGGSLVQGRTKITDSAGSFAIVADPEGNELGLWVP